MFPVYINDENLTELPEDEIFYIIAKEGIFLKKRVGVMESIAPVQNISILDSIQGQARMHIKKIPGEKFGKVHDFFKKVYEEYHGESIVLLFYDEEKEKYTILPPEQEVSSAKLKYERFTIDNLLLLGTIHSHGNMSAFHSSVDDKDEKTFDGLHITLGDLKDDEFSISASIVANGMRVMVDPSEYISGIKLTHDIDEMVEVQQPKSRSWKMVDGKYQMVEEKSETKLVHKFDKRYVSTIAENRRKSNPKWMDKVSKFVYTTNAYNHLAGHYGYDYDYGHIPGTSRFTPKRSVSPGHIPSIRQIKQMSKGWGNNFDPTFWENERGNVSNHEECGDLPKCLTCAHREEKILLEETYNDDIDVYYCKRCDIVVPESDDPDVDTVCPKCKSENELILYEGELLEDNYEDISDYEIGMLVTCPTCWCEIKIEDPEATICPFCSTDLTSEMFSSEDNLIEQQCIDSGTYIDPDYDDINQSCLNEVNNINEKIPDPEKDVIPINPPTKTPDNVLQKMFKSVFGGKGNA